MTDAQFQAGVQLEIQRLIRGGQAQDRRVGPDKHRERFEAVLAGDAKDFWTTSRLDYDVEQQTPIFEAVARATRAPGATDAQRWKIVERAIRDLAMQYAEHDPENDSWGAA